MTSSGPEVGVPEADALAVHHERGRRGEAEHAAGRAAGERVRVERAARPPRRRAPTRRRAARTAACPVAGFEDDADLVEHEHVEGDVQEAVVHDRVRERAGTTRRRARAGPKSARSNEVCAAAVEASVAQRDHEERDDRADDDRLASPRRSGSPRAAGAAPVRVRGGAAAFTHSKHCEPTDAWTQAVGARGPPAARAAAPGLPIRDGGNRSSAAPAVMAGRHGTGPRHCRSGPRRGDRGDR